MKFKKVVYIRYLPLTEKIYKDFYFKEVLDAGIEIEYWDITHLFFNRLDSRENSNHLCAVKIFDNYKILETEIKDVDSQNTLFISIMTFSSEQTKLYSLFLKYNIKVGIFGALPFPSINQGSKLWNLSIKKLVSKTFIKKIYNDINFRSRLLGRKNPFRFNVIFSAGELGYLGIGKYSIERFKTTRIISVNYSDYDIAQSLITNNSYSSEGYILFIDEYLPLHPDTKLLGRNSIDTDKYYDDLNNFFNQIEHSYNLKVIIAAHPKALKYKEKDYFCGRSVFFNQTAELVKNANFILMHDSTSYMYPIYFKKPILFMTSKEIEMKIPLTHKNILAIASSLNATYVYFDEYLNKSVYPFSLDEKRYTDVLSKRFMSSENPKLKTSEVFLNYLIKE